MPHFRKKKYKCYYAKTFAVQKDKKKVLFRRTFIPDSVTFYIIPYRLTFVKKIIIYGTVNISSKDFYYFAWIAGGEYIGGNILRHHTA